jgi:hypothetical protein
MAADRAVEAGTANGLYRCQGPRLLAAIAATRLVCLALETGRALDHATAFEQGTDQPAGSRVFDISLKARVTLMV